MFEIREGVLPFVRTRQALLVLDLQNDLVSTGGILPVDKPENLVSNIINLAAQVRGKDNVIWVKTIFEAHRDINNRTSDSEWVITDDEVPKEENAESVSTIRGLKPSKKLLELYDKILERHGGEEDDEDEQVGAACSEDPPEELFDDETFLSIPPGKQARCLLPGTKASEFPQVVNDSIANSRDLVFTKSHYSAFKSGELLKSLRGQFVTELYICGALTNTSIYATAMDAARHGYAITLVEDCLGYRSKSRHEEALRLLVEATGCEIKKSAEILEEVRGHQSTESRSSSTKKRIDGDNDNGHKSVSGSKLKGDKNESESKKGTASSTTKSVVVPVTEGVSQKESSLHKTNEPNPESSKESQSPASGSLKKQEIEAKKRVPNRIKTRRHQSKSTETQNGTSSSAEVSKNGAQSKKDGNVLSPTQATLTAASEALQRIGLASSTDHSAQTSEKSGEIKNVAASTNSISTRSASKTSNQKASRRVSEIPSLDEDQGNLLQQLAAVNIQEIGGPSTLEPVILEDAPKPICEGDTVVIQNLLSEADVDGLFEKIRDEVRWQRMSHQGGDVPRLVAVQGSIQEDGSIPIYRHPADESVPLQAFTPSVALVKEEVERRLGHAVNHCLIQLYRTGSDYISEHSDKTLDIVPDTFIANVSLGALRSMTFRTKKNRLESPDPNQSNSSRTSYKVSLPHNSMCKMGLTTNMKWLHSIRQDKRMEQEKSEAELAYGTMRLSLTFRSIGTFLDKAQIRIWGQGAVAKHKKHARSVINGQSKEAENMLLAFGKENHSSDFDWPEVYGQGFDVLHISNTRKLVLSSDPVSNLRVKAMLAEYDRSWTPGNSTSSFDWKDLYTKDESISSHAPPEVMLADNDIARSKVQGDLAILLYLDTVYNPQKSTKSQLDVARQFTRLQLAETLLQQWRAVPFEVRPFRRNLALWDSFAAEDLFLAGSRISVTDFAAWPVLKEIVDDWGDGIESPNLKAYYERMLEHKSIQTALEIPMASK